MSPLKITQVKKVKRLNWNESKDSDFITTYRNRRLFTRDDFNNPNESDQEKANASGNQQVLAIHSEAFNDKPSRAIFNFHIFTNSHQNEADESQDLKLIG